jgi:hypothetical protein
MDEPDFSDEEVDQVFKSLNKGKCVGFDLYPAEIYIHGGADMVKMIKTLANLMKNTLKVPTQFYDTVITTLHKKGSIKILRNKRGIFLCIVISKVLEKLIKQRIEQNLADVNSFQFGSKRNKGCPDLLFLVRAVIDHAKYTGKTIYVTLYDYSQCFDSLWLEDCIVSLWKLGVSRQLLALIKGMNEQVNMIVNTPHGMTKQRSLKNIVKQGSVLGSNLCSTSTGELAAESGTGVNIGLVNIISVIYVDDSTNLNDSSANTVVSHNNTMSFKRKKRLDVNAEKCHIMVINRKAKEKVPVLMIGDEEMSEVKSAKIVGDHINEKGTNTDLVCARTKKGKSIIVNTFALCNELSMGCFSLHIQMLMYQAVYLSSVLFNCQSWTRLTKTDCKNLRMNQLKYLKRMMHAPNSTKDVSVFLELGILPILHEINQRRLIFLHHILFLPLDDPVRKVYKEQLTLPLEANWANEMQQLKRYYRIEHEDHEIESLSVHSWKRIVKSQVRGTAFGDMRQSAREGKSKNIDYTDLDGQQYVLSLLPAEARTIFRFRTRTVYCKANHKQSYNDFSCRLCKHHPYEDQEHLVNCDVVRGSDLEIDVSRTFMTDFHEDKDFVKKLVQRLATADELLHPGRRNM